jgi:putative transposase
VARKRFWWRKYLSRIDISRFVFIDETWTKTNMAPVRGWGAKGKRLIGWAPHGRWKTLTFLAGLRADGIIAPWLLNGPINGESFLIYVRDVLAPALRKGDIVVMDNLGSHKAKAIRDIIRSVGARLIFLPPYSPDLNPIEQFFAKLKHHLRKLKARTEEALNHHIGNIIRATTKAECTNCVTNAGYRSM